MKKLILVALIFLLQSQIAEAQNLRNFLKSCAWGTLGGATLGVVSLAFTDKPSESWGNVAKGASLGLYAGIAYGVYQLNKEPESTSSASDYVVVPVWQQGRIEGVQVAATVWQF